MNQPIEITTSTGAVRASSEDLARAVAELIAAEPTAAPSEDDLVEAITLDLDLDGSTGSLSDFSIPA